MEQQETTYSILTFPHGTMPASYKNLIIANFLRSLRRGNDFYKLSEPDSYYRAYRRFVHMLLEHPHTVVRLAVLSDAKDIVYCFALHRDEVLDFWFVFKDYRGQGIGRALFPDNIAVVSHITKTWILMWSRDKYKDIVFNPFI